MEINTRRVKDVVFADLVGRLDSQTCGPLLALSISVAQVCAQSTLRQSSSRATAAPSRSVRQTLW